MGRSCCGRDYNRVFGARFAGRAARKYRKRGLDKTSRRMVEFLRSRGIDDATVLEIGGGVGEIELELLKVGAARARNLELSATYEDEARKLAAEVGLSERVEFRVHDIAVDPQTVEPADVVVLHRVVCCYSDYERLLAAAADHARRALVFSYPPRNSPSRALVALFNAAMWLKRSSFRAFVHPPPAMIGVLGRHGLRQEYAHRGRMWHVSGLERA